MAKRKKTYEPVENQVPPVPYTIPTPTVEERVPPPEVEEAPEPAPNPRDIGRPEMWHTISRYEKDEREYLTQAGWCVANGALVRDLIFADGELISHALVFVPYCVLTHLDKPNEPIVVDVRS